MSKEDNFPERIDLVINKLNGPSEFARQTGVTLSTIARWRKGEAEPSRPNLVRIAEATGVSIQWLATGEECGIKQPQNSIKSEINLFLDDGSEFIDDYRAVNVSAGFGAFNNEAAPQKIRVESAWLQSRGLKAKDCAMFTVRGDSMYPTLKDGEEIIVNRAKKDLQEGKIFVINHQGVMWVKKIHINFNGLDLVSDNPTYQPIKLTADEANSLNVIGQVVRSYRNF